MFYHSNLRYFRRNRKNATKYLVEYILQVDIRFQDMTFISPVVHIYKMVSYLLKFITFSVYLVLLFLALEIVSKSFKKFHLLICLVIPCSWEWEEDI